MIYQFGSFELDPGRRRLVRDGHPVTLTPKVFDTLLVLLKNHGRLLTKEELLSTLWPDRVVEEANLTQSISVLRKALGERNGERWIVTVPGRGYQFAGEVVEADGVRSTPKLTSRKWGPVVVVILLALASMGFLFRFPLGRKPPSFESIVTRRLTQSANVRVATLSPDGRRIAFVSGRPGPQSLRFRDIEGTFERTLVGPGEDHFMGVTFSPDGAELFFLARKPADSNGTLYRLSVTGGIPQRFKGHLDSPISFSPDGSRFAFVREYPERRESVLMLANRDGSQETELVARKLPEYLDYPAWAPDGNSIACTVVHGQTAGLLLVSLPNREVRSASKQIWHSLASLSWAGDGRNLVTAGRMFGGEMSPIWLVSVPGGEPHPIGRSLENFYRVHSSGDKIIAIHLSLPMRLLITHTTIDGAVPPGSRWTAIPELSTARSNRTRPFAWAPDGTMITGDGDLFVSHLNGTRLRQLTRGGNNRSPGVCGDGRHVVYMAEKDGRHELWRVGSDGRNPVRLVAHSLHGRPRCSPDGQWVVYSAYGRQGWTVLWRVPIEGGEPVQLSEEVARLPAISPDGTMIAAFHSDPKQGEQGYPARLAIFSSTGGRAVRTMVLPDSTDMLVPPRWTPDGKGIAFGDERGSSSNIWVMPLDGGPSRALTNFSTESIGAFDWAWDGKQLAVATRASPEDMVLIENRP